MTVVRGKNLRKCPLGILVLGRMDYRHNEIREKEIRENFHRRKLYLWKMQGGNQFHTNMPKPFLEFVFSTFALFLTIL